MGRCCVCVLEDRAGGAKVRGTGPRPFDYSLSLNWLPVFWMPLRWQT
jgi:hypothetical protein